MLVLAEFEGITPLIMNSSRGIDSLDPLSVLITQLHSKKPRTDAIQAEMDRLEWQRSMYFDSTTGPYIPAANILRCLRNAGPMVEKRGGAAAIERGFLLADARIPLQYDGPRDMDGLAKDGRFLLRHYAKIGQARVMKNWAIFPAWKISFEAHVAEEMLDFEKLQRIAEMAGSFEGLCDNRKRGGYGRFRAALASAPSRRDTLAA